MANDVSLFRRNANTASTLYLPDKWVDDAISRQQTSKTRSRFEPAIIIPPDTIYFDISTSLHDDKHGYIYMMNRPRGADAGD